MENLITEVDILDEAKECFLTYAEEVLTDRAIPAAEDGLLSSQRKILWTMSDVLKMDSKSKTKKCNALVGYTLATSYFHGDASCYGVLCKMAQEYLMRYPLIDGQGSLGTQENNDMISSSRYTEARPSIFADLMMLDYKKNPVPVKETYNNEYMEPVFLPSFFPNALCNGRQAIGISMAHNSASHNLTEVCNGIIRYINNNNVTIDELMEDIKGPDFPLGGTIINAKDIKSAYKTGRSNVSLKIRGDYEIDDNKIIFTSIPYRTYRNKIKEQLEKNVDVFEGLLEDFEDQSALGQNKLIFTIKKTSTPQAVLRQLFKLTDLQTTLSFNMNFIVNGTPRLCSLKDLIKAYVEHQYKIIINIATVDKAKAEQRVHIIEGMLIALEDIDTAISLIKNSDNKTEAQNKLIQHFNIDLDQAKAILDITLSRLTRLDRDDLLNELKSKKDLVIENDRLINDSKYRAETLVQRIINMRNKYGDERRTKLLNIEEKETKEEKEIALIPPEKCVVVMTESGSLKRIPATSFKTQRRGGKGVKTQEDITSAVIRTNTVDSLMIFSNKGKMYRLVVNNIPEGTNTSKGTPVRALVEMEPDEDVQIIYSIYRDTDAKYVLFVTKNGLVKKTALSEYVGTKKSKGIGAINIKDGDSLAVVTLVKDEPLLLISKNGYVIKFKSDEINATGRLTAGVKGINLSDGDEVVAALPIRHSEDSLAIFSTKGYGKKIKLNDITLQKRGGKGIIIYKPNDLYGNASCGQLVSDEDIVLLIGNKNSVCINATEIPEMGRVAYGNIMLKNNNIVSASKV